MANICKVNNCTNPVVAYGHCSKHWQRIYKRGTLELTRDWGKGTTHEERFWSRVKKTEGCWLWQGAKIKNGYGTVTVNYQKWYAHRYSWFLTKKIKPTLHLLHSCDTPLCVNPAHLREGTDADNANDMVIRNRSLKGEKNPVSKLTNENVLEIKAKLSEGCRTTTLAKEYNVSAVIISQIKHGTRWQWLQLK